MTRSPIYTRYSLMTWRATYFLRNLTACAREKQKNRHKRELQNFYVYARGQNSQEFQFSIGSVDRSPHFFAARLKLCVFCADGRPTYFLRNLMTSDLFSVVS